MALMNAIHRYFATYSGSRAELSVIVEQSFSDIEREDLEHCYTVTTNPLNALLRDIKDRQPKPICFKCQYCGINNPRSIDHYLPKSKFPEFSVHSLNLMPCCEECNRIKGDIFLKDGERQIINFYFDPLPDDRYLNVRIDYRNDTPVAEYYLSRTANIPKKTFRLIENHYQRLNLFKRLQENSTEIFSETSASMIYKQIISIETVKNLLLDKAQYLASHYSSNYWQAVLYEALANETRFLQGFCIMR